MFTVCLLLVLQVMTVAYDHYCVRDHTNKIFWILSKRDETYPVAFLGSSRSQSNFSGEYLEKELGIKSINLGNGGSSPIDQYLILENFLSQGNKIDRLVLALDDDALDTTSFTQPFQYYSFLPKLDRPVNREVVHDYWGARSLVYYIPFYKYAEFNGQIGAINFFNMMRGKPATFDSWGCKLSDREFVKRDFRPSRVVVHEIARKYFEKIIDVCEREHIQLWLVYPPDHPDIQRSRMGREEIMDYYSKLADRHAVRFIRYDQLPEFSGSQYFRDARHLNKKGAILLSARLMKTMTSPD